MSTAIEEAANALILRRNCFFPELAAPAKRMTGAGNAGVFRQFGMRPVLAWGGDTDRGSPRFGRLSAEKIFGGGVEKPFGRVEDSSNPHCGGTFPESLNAGPIKPKTCRKRRSGDFAANPIIRRESFELPASGISKAPSPRAFRMAPVLRSCFSVPVSKSSEAARP